MKLAIFGNEKKGSEVIEFLESIGGINQFNYKGDKSQNIYYINNSNIINVEKWLSLPSKHDFSIYSFDLLIKEYPHKLNEKVWWTCGIELKECIIRNMHFCDNEMIYTLETLSGDFIYCTKQNISKFDMDTLTDINIKGSIIRMATPQTINISDIETDKIEIVLSDKLEMLVEDGKTYIVKKPIVFPTDYKDCTAMLGVFDNVDFEDYEEVEFALLKQLIICRNAYWKIAGEQMGLGKPWEPDWSMYSEKKYCIKYSQNEIKSCEYVTESKLLAFPTKDIRNKFLESFRKLIEECAKYI